MLAPTKADTDRDKHRTVDMNARCTLTPAEAETMPNDQRDPSQGKSYGMGQEPNPESTYPQG